MRVDTEAIPESQPALEREIVSEREVALEHEIARLLMMQKLFSKTRVRSPQDTGALR